MLSYIPYSYWYLSVSPIACLWHMRCIAHLIAHCQAYHMGTLSISITIIPVIRDFFGSNYTSTALFGGLLVQIVSIAGLFYAIVHVVYLKLKK